MSFLSFADTIKSPAHQRILATAHELFYRQGIRATGINQVIAEAEVTKVTFYRHFPSKDDLILAYLENRHVAWMTWFNESLERHGGTLSALIPTLSEWFNHPAYRGCAFLNGVSELGQSLSGVLEIAQRHKARMAESIARLLPQSNNTMRVEAIALALDGAIMHCQTHKSPQVALAILRTVIDAFGYES